MKLHKFSFSQSEFQKLPVEDQALFASLAHVRNDIRHLSFLLISSSPAVSASSGAEKTIALHHYQHILRLLSATLHEAWKVIEKGWHGAKLGQTRYSELSLEGQEAVRALGRYFGDAKNSLHRIRNEVGFHYDIAASSAWLKLLPGEATHEIVSGDLSHNTFHLFPEIAVNRAIFGIEEADDMVTTERKVQSVGNEILRVLDLFVAFSDAYFMATMSKLKYSHGDIEVSEGINPHTCPTVVIAENPSPANVA